MERLESKVISFLRSRHGDFDSLAIELWAYQFARDEPYQAYCRALGKTPGEIRAWRDIPAVPIAAFKSAELATFPVQQAAAVWESSGTTQTMRSRHYIRKLTYYEMALKASFAREVLPEGSRPTFLILTPSPGEAPRSSLSWMMDVVMRAYGAPDSAYMVVRGRLDELYLATRLAKAEAEKRPVALLGTTAAFLVFLNFASRNGRRYGLAPGSLLMDTGGLKTDKRQVTRSEFVRRVQVVFDIKESACINEYGMCELSSQFYGRGASSYLAGPPWTRTLVIDPATGHPARAGQAGLLRHFDLANVDSVLAIQTDDVGVAEGSGFVLQGRDPAAEVKGCSLSAEAFLA